MVKITVNKEGFYVLIKVNFPERYKNSKPVCTQ